MAKTPLVNAPQIDISQPSAFRDWLANHHTRTAGVWVVTYKKSHPERYVPTTDIVDTCLCFGWVDSLPRAKDDVRTMLYISPRKPGSHWSRVNKEKVARLEAAGQMHPAGLAVVDRAKNDGSWAALDDVENLVIPPDLQAAFDTVPEARSNWDSFPRSVKRGALEILLNAKRAATRNGRIDQIVTDCAQNRRPFQWRK